MRFLKNRNFIIMVVTVTLLGICAALSGIFPRPQLVGANTQEVIVVEKGQMLLNTSEQDSWENDEAEVSEELYDHILVHIAGEVENPGVYSLNSDSRVINAVEAAGGMTKKAASNQVNLAMLISDGQQVYIPSIDEVEPKQISEPKNRLIVTEEEIAVKKEALMVNVNTASVTELTLLPGVGTATAENIISYRESIGRFNSVEELIHVSGIGEAKLSKIYPYVKVE